MTKEKITMIMAEVMAECEAELMDNLKDYEADSDIVNLIHMVSVDTNKSMAKKVFSKLFGNTRCFDKVRTTATKPERSTSAAACYDFISPISITIPAGCTVSIPTGIKAKFPKDEALMLYSRSGMGFKHNIVLTNGTAIIDSDYYGNKTNDGEIIVGLRNMGKESYTVKAGDKIAQGMFVKINLTDDDRATATREGGLGSTGK